MQTSDNHTPLREEVIRLFTNFSIEICPREANTIADFRRHIPPGTKVFIPYVSGDSAKLIIETATKLSEQEMTPVAHLPARRILNQDHLFDYVEALREKANIRELFIIGGDPNPPLGDYSSTLEILNSGILQRSDISKIGLAFHPEDHPHVSRDTLQTELKNKIDLCDKTTIQPYLISQFVLSDKPLIEWANNLEIDTTLFVRANIPGLAPTKRVLKYAQQCGVNDRLSVFTNRKETAAEISFQSNLEQILLKLAEYNLTRKETIFDSVHISPFGTFESSSKWARAIMEGGIKTKAQKPNRSPNQY